VRAEITFQQDTVYVRGIERLVAVVQQLARARSQEEIQRIVCVAARELTGADGATFVVREGDRCFYAEEDAIAPLWKGMRFPFAACIGGWVMLHQRPAVIDDIYDEARIPADAYRPTFVKSLVMVPIRVTGAPIGAIGNYWARRRLPTDAEVRLLQALADATSVALESVQARQSQTAEAVGRLARGVAHDFTQLLSVILGAARTIRAELAPGQPPCAALEEIGRTAESGIRLAEQLLASSRGQEIGPAPDDGVPPPAGTFERRPAH
jgi:signal transduction histidine kinase